MYGIGEERMVREGKAQEGKEKRIKEREERKEKRKKSGNMRIEIQVGERRKERGGKEVIEGSKEIASEERKHRAFKK